MLRHTSWNVFAYGSLCVYVYLHFPKLEIRSKTKNLGFGSQLTEVVATFPSVKGGCDPK